MLGTLFFRARSGGAEKGQKKASEPKRIQIGRPSDPEGRPICHLILSLYSPGVIPTYFLKT